MNGSVVIVGGTTISGLSAGSANFKNGVLTLATTNNKLNASGVTYTYQVL